MESPSPDLGSYQGTPPDKQKTLLAVPTKTRFFPKPRSIFEGFERDATFKALKIFFDPVARIDAHLREAVLITRESSGSPS